MKHAVLCPSSHISLMYSLLYLQISWVTPILIHSGLRVRIIEKTLHKTGCLLNAAFRKRGDFSCDMQSLLKRYCHGLRVELMVLHLWRSSLRWFRHLVRMRHGRLPGDVFLDMSDQEETLRHDVLEGLYFLGWPGSISVPPEGTKYGWGEGGTGPAWLGSCPCHFIGW